MSTKPYWYKSGFIYGLDVRLFQDSNGNGCGDFQGLIQRLDYLVDLGVDGIWLLPFYPTPYRDNGYDVSDYYNIDPRTGDLPDFIEFMQAAEQRGLHVIIDLVANHTSDQHPWFQAARRDKNSRFRDYYVWTDDPPQDSRKPIFPGQEDSVWTYDEVAGAYFYHLFYHFQPGLKFANPQVQQEFLRIMDYWLSYRVAGFRLDAVSHMIQKKGIESSKPENPEKILNQFYELGVKRREDIVLLGESDVDVRKLDKFFGDGDELTMLFNFLLSENLFLSFAIENGQNLIDLLEVLPEPPKNAQYANFLRNLDELDLERLTEAERRKVFDDFAPRQDMRIFGRGIRRRLAPMFQGDRRRMELAYSLLFSMPGAPVVAYGDEIGMGDDLSLKGRNAVRTPMQWSAEPNAGFSQAPQEDLIAPLISEGSFSNRKVNVAVQRSDPDSFLNWFKSLVAVHKRFPALGLGRFTTIRDEDASVLAHYVRYEGQGLLAVHNFQSRPACRELNLKEVGLKKPNKVFGNAPVQQQGEGRLQVDLPPYGYVWLSIE